MKSFLIVLLLLISESAFTQEPDENLTRALSLRMVSDFWNSEKLVGLGEFISSDYVNHAPQGVTQTLNQAITAKTRLMRQTPDLHFTVEDILVDGNKSFIRANARFKHNTMLPAPPFGLIAPSSNDIEKEITFAVWWSYEVEGGMIVRGWELQDKLHRYEQMGMVPVMGPNDDPRVEDCNILKQTLDSFCPQ